MAAMAGSGPTTHCYRQYPLSYGCCLRKRRFRRPGAARLSKPGGDHRGHSQSAHSLPRR